MTLDELLNDNSKKIKEKTETISNWLLDGSLPMEELIAFAEIAKDTAKATCIEAIEYATQKTPAISDENVLSFATQSLTNKAPRVKWESAKVIGNIAPLFPTKLDLTLSNLILNANDKGTVVRWATAYALGEILKLKTKHHNELLNTLEALCDTEDNNGVKKKYLEALKVVRKKQSAT